MNIQFGERLLGLSPTLAAQIGLEEAVLAQLVYELSHICPTKTLQQKEWFYLAPERWQELIPFWNMTKLDTIFRNLESIKLVERYHNQNGQFLVRLIPDNAFHPATAAQNRVEQPVQRPAMTAQNHLQQYGRNNAARTRNQQHAGLPTFMIEQTQQFSQQSNYRSAMESNWRPDEKMLVPRLMADNIPVDFAREQLPDFISHYSETGVVAADWNTRFIRWVKEEWAKLSRNGYGQQPQNKRQDQRDEVRRKIMDIYDTNW
jgi:hypothetical protein